MSIPLPPGQKVSAEFPRFGINHYAKRFPTELDAIRLTVKGDLANELIVSDQLAHLPRIEQLSDFHCVTTWCYRNARWGGYRFSDFYEQIIMLHAQPTRPITHVVLRGQDGYRTSLPLADLLASDVLLADTFNGKPLTIEHGAPIRLVAPAHYGYKNLKHLTRIEFWHEAKVIKHGILKFMDHPRARVAYEERTTIGFGRFFRYLYRPLIRPTAKTFHEAMQENRGT